MTYDEFLSHLHAEQGWRLREFDGGQLAVRTWPGDECPLARVNNDLGHAFRFIDFVGAARHLGIEEALANRIASAADGNRDADPAVRRDLLLACGLKRDPEEGA